MSIHEHGYEVMRDTFGLSLSTAFAPGTSSPSLSASSSIGGDEVMFDVIRHMWRHDAFMAVVIDKERGTPRAGDVLGVITKDHVADSVAASIQIYPGEQ